MALYKFTSPAKIYIKDAWNTVQDTESLTG